MSHSPTDQALIDRQQFPYTAVPHARFEMDEPALAPAAERWITDTTFRDGQQARAPFTAEQVEQLFSLLHRLDQHSGVIRQSEFFLYSTSERRIVQRCRERGYRFPEVTAWIRARSEDLRLVRELEIAETGILTSVSDLHIVQKLGWNRQEAQRRYLEVVDEALAAGIRPRCHFEDVTRADVPGFVVPFAAALVERSQQAGMAVKIRLCDTMGVGLPWAAAALPRGVPRLVRTLIEEAGVPEDCLEWHGHNDCFKGHANAATAWLYGCAAVNTTLLGIGERSGNAPLEGAVLEYMGLQDEPVSQPAPDLTVLIEIAAYLRRECGVQIPPNYPLVGDEAFATRAGVHIDGLLKDPETYLSFDPRAVLRRPIEVVVSDRSGAAGIAWWVNSRLEHAHQSPLAKTDSGVRAMYKELLARYEAGVTENPSEAELLALAARHLPAHLVRALGAA